MQVIGIFKAFRSSSVEIHLKDKTAVFSVCSYSWTYLYSHKREKVQIKLGPQFFIIVLQVPGTGVFLPSLPPPSFSSFACTATQSDMQ